jgi:protoporphyrinogen oxidase
LTRTGRHGEIHVWEKDEHPGGLAGTFTTQDFTVEKFYHHIFAVIVLFRLAVGFGAGRRACLATCGNRAYYVQQPYKLASPLDILRFKPLPFVDRFRLGWLALHARTIRNWQALDDLQQKNTFTILPEKKSTRLCATVISWEIRRLCRDCFGGLALV